ncbi:Uncharacterised protein [Candidatus Bartonella washoeensis]|uniref:hypothetical protein n=1 Tax=Candidatus Bartonella washoeensis TaxID=186739 RepID=UPI000D921D88|nr:hypothetical protein [Bartonella washoeensis]SPU26259.1 Uncharacterised protein [Bartonella washoeensis]
MENDAIIEGKIEKVFEPITIRFFTTIGALGFGFLTESILAYLLKYSDEQQVKFKQIKKVKYLKLFGYFSSVKEVFFQLHPALIN